MSTVAVRLAQRSGRIPAIQSVRYAADSVSVLFNDPAKYFGDLTAGVTQTMTALETDTTHCPASRIVLAGYSQGAMVMHRVLAQLGTTAAGRQILSRVAAAVLIGDGDQVPYDTGVTRYGTAPMSAHGVGQALRTVSHSSAVKFTASVGSRVLSVCTNHDPVCAWTDTNLWLLTASAAIGRSAAQVKKLERIHANYTGTQPVLEAADRAARMADH